jgi:hypothetical protein
MHGSRQTLTSWMLAALHFCISQDGLCVKELQTLLNLSTYRSAWLILHRIRLGAGLTVKKNFADCSGTIFFDLYALAKGGLQESSLQTACFLKLTAAPNRCRQLWLLFLGEENPGKIKYVLEDIVKNQRHPLLVGPSAYPYLFKDQPQGRITKAPEEICRVGATVIQRFEFWLNEKYRGAVHPRYLQTYIDEFCFRINAGRWVNGFEVFEDLVAGLLAPGQLRRKASSSAISFTSNLEKGDA